MRRERVARWFEDNFGGAPVLWSRAPGRVDLMGSHTDYNLGFVLTLAISRDTWVAARPREDRIVQLYAANLDALGFVRSPRDPGSRRLRRDMGRLSARSGLGARSGRTAARRIRWCDS